MKKVSSRFFAATLFIMQIVSVPVHAGSLPKSLEPEYRQDAAEKLEEVVKIYNQAVVAYEAQGPQAFTSALGDNIQPTDAAVLRRKLGTLIELPRLTLNKQILMVHFKDQSTFKLEAFDVAAGVYYFPSLTLQYNHSKTLQQNLEQWEQESAKFSSSTGGADLFEKISDIFFPSAFARSRLSKKWNSKSNLGKAALIMAGTVALILAGKSFLPKILAWKKGNPETAPLVPSSYADPTHDTDLPVQSSQPSVAAAKPTPKPAAKKTTVNPVRSETDQVEHEDYLLESIPNKEPAPSIAEPDSSQVPAATPEPPKLNRSVPKAKFIERSNPPPEAPMLPPPSGPGN